MIGWITLALLGLAAAAALVLLKIGRPLWMAAAAALVLGAAGYAAQGRPSLPAAAPQPAADAAELDEDMGKLRLAMFGRFTYAEQMFVTSDGLIRAGAPRSAVSLLIGAVAAQRTSPGVWTALGQAYAAADNDTVSPASRFAFDQAMRIAPRHAGPPFFLGLAYLRQGDLLQARRWWARALDNAPEEAAYREEIAERLMLLDGLLAFEDRR